MTPHLTSSTYDYDKSGHGYAGHRRTDPRIESLVLRELGDARTVLNVGAGAGSYEPADRYVVAVEPSATMRAQRAQNHKVPAVAASAESLPFDNKSFDASMAMITIHHWKDKMLGLSELKRVTRKRIVIMTFDPDAFYDFWTAEYFRELIDLERKRFPSINEITEALGGSVKVIPVMVPFDCVDGIMEAYYGRPEGFLNRSVRAAQSAWGLLPHMEDEFVARLEKDLKSGEWDRRYGHLRTQPEFSCTLRLIVSEQEA